MAFRSPTVIPGNGATHQLIKTDRSMLALSDETSVMKQIQATHCPDGREFDVRPLLDIVEDILKRATLQVETTLTVIINTKILQLIHLIFHELMIADSYHFCLFIAANRVSCRVR